MNIQVNISTHSCFVVAKTHPFFMVCSTFHTQLACLLFHDSPRKIRSISTASLVACRFLGGWNAWNVPVVKSADSFPSTTKPVQPAKTSCLKKDATFLRTNPYPKSLLSRWFSGVWWDMILTIVRSSLLSPWKSKTKQRMVLEKWSI